MPDEPKKSSASSPDARGSAVQPPARSVSVADYYRLLHDMLAKREALNAAIYSMQMLLRSGAISDPPPAVDASMQSRVLHQEDVTGSQAHQEVSDSEPQDRAEAFRSIAERAIKEAIARGEIQLEEEDVSMQSRVHSGEDAGESQAHQDHSNG